MITYEKVVEYIKYMKEDIVSEIANAFNTYENYFVFKTLHDVEFFEVDFNKNNNTAEAYFEGRVTEGYLVDTTDGKEPEEAEQEIHFVVPLEADDEGNIKYILPRDSKGAIYPYSLIKCTSPDPFADYYPDL